MIENGLILFIELLTSIFYESFENHLKIYYDVLKMMPFDTFFLLEVYKYYIYTHTYIYIQYICRQYIYIYIYI